MSAIDLEATVELVAKHYREGPGARAAGYLPFGEELAFKDEWTVFTNGFVITGIRRPSSARQLPSQLEGVAKDVLTPWPTSHAADLAVLLEDFGAEAVGVTCRDCKGRGWCPCDRCDDGFCTCDCGDEHNCGECKGSGKEDCYHCVNGTYWPAVKRQIGSGVFNVTMIAPLLGALANQDPAGEIETVISVKDDGSMLAVTCGEVVTAMMGLRLGESSDPIPTLNLEALRPAGGAA